MFAYFLAEMMSVTPDPSATWNVFTNESSKGMGNGTNLILESDTWLIVEVSMCFDFTTTNNQE